MAPYATSHHLVLFRRSCQILFRLMFLGLFFIQLGLSGLTDIWLNWWLGRYCISYRDGIDQIRVAAITCYV